MNKFQFRSLLLRASAIGTRSNGYVAPDKNTALKNVYEGIYLAHHIKRHNTLKQYLIYLT